MARYEQPKPSPEKISPPEEENKSAKILRFPSQTPRVEPVRPEEENEPENQRRAELEEELVRHHREKKEREVGPEPEKEARQQLFGLLTQLRSEGDIFEILNQNNEAIYERFADFKRLETTEEQELFKRTYVQGLEKLRQAIGREKQEMVKQSKLIADLKRMKKNIEAEYTQSISLEEDNRPWWKKIFTTAPAPKRFKSPQEYDAALKRIEDRISREREILVSRISEKILSEF